MRCPFCRDWFPPELWDYETGTCVECEVFVTPGNLDEEDEL